MSELTHFHKKIKIGLDNNQALWYNKGVRLRNT